MSPFQWYENTVCADGEEAGLWGSERYPLAALNQELLWLYLSPQRGAVSWLQSRLCLLGFLQQLSAPFRVTSGRKERRGEKRSSLTASRRLSLRLLAGSEGSPSSPLPLTYPGRGHLGVSAVQPGLYSLLSAFCALVVIPSILNLTSSHTRDEVIAKNARHVHRALIGQLRSRGRDQRKTRH